jgi:hypothetical protein
MHSGDAGGDGKDDQLLAKRPSHMTAFASESIATAEAGAALSGNAKTKTTQTLRGVLPGDPIDLEAADAAEALLGLDGDCFSDHVSVAVDRRNDDQSTRR